MNTAPIQHWDIFCRVVDNFGDIGVCWRLARQLHIEYKQQVRLWLDAPAALTPLCPDYAGQDNYCLEGIEIRHWPPSFPDTPAADIVIEAFACDLPPGYLEAMRHRQHPCLWINLEYLSAEQWVEDCHGLASPQGTGLPAKYFFFPGFTPKTGGLLCEATLRRQPTPPAQRSLPDTLVASLFCYDSAPVAGLFDAITGASIPIRCLVAPGKPVAAVQRYLGKSLPATQGRLTLEPAAFLPQIDYDSFLLQCDLNFIRGEDSFLRAQWAGKPFVWQIYPQEDDTHLRKLDAFLGRYLDGAAPPLAAALPCLFRAWNSQSGTGLAQAWHDCLQLWPDWCEHAFRWAETLKNQSDLADRLTQFVTARL